MRKENDQLKNTVQNLESKQPTYKVEELATIDDEFKATIKYTVRSQYSSSEEHKTIKTTWGEIFSMIAPDLLEHPSDGSVNFKLGSALYRKSNPKSDKTVQVVHDDFQTIKTQFMALNLIDVRYSQTTKGGMGLFWTLSKTGMDLMLRLRTIKKNIQPDS
ncbi:hypothetical protein QEH56_23915 [Pelagicoccus enzymogenes]|uniref:hypothetical protein n=1 Tax=Pelagicoccus enzymogenes TaxID=2773457 RepID=UPI00280E441B|nr:hypothetical protein [Pelagicoccus enzymogenes]MDQ8201232.1 hypothetical protein [Pelagicoccus enzymogenes]